MKTDYIKQVWYDMRYQPVIGVVTVVGTALAIFFIMVAMMLHQVYVMPFAPESRRDCMLVGQYVNVKQIKKGGNSSGAFTESFGKRIYLNLKSAKESALVHELSPYEAMVPGGEISRVYTMGADDAIFRIFDYDFVAGQPFDKASVESGTRRVVLSASTARFFFGSPESAAGKTIFMQSLPFTVVGVFKDVSPLARNAYAEAIIPYSSVSHEGWDEYIGDFSAMILADTPADIPDIKAEVAARVAALNTELEKDEKMVVHHGSPYTIEETTSDRYSNGDSNFDYDRHKRYITYLILLIIPAINLSSMTRSRLRHRMAEIGVRRAYGATRTDVMLSLLIENFILTLAGAVIGMVLCVVFDYLFANMLFSDLLVARDIDIPWSVLFNWRVFAMAIGLSFVFNLLSAGLPAWQASRVDPVNALNNRNF